MRIQLLPLLLLPPLPQLQLLVNGLETHEANAVAGADSVVVDDDSDLGHTCRCTPGRREVWGRLACAAVVVAGEELGP